MPHFEHTRTVAKPFKEITAVFTPPEADALFAPPIIRITLVASDDGRAADLTYERLRTTATSTPNHESLGRDPPVHIGATFAGPTVEGRVSYQLTPQDGATRLTQQAEYEFTDGAIVNVVEPATTAHNDQQFAARLTTVKDLLEASSRLPPLNHGDTVDSNPTVPTL